MILHASIAADDPQKTAQTLATLLGGLAFPMPGGGGAWAALTGDEHGTNIQVLGRGRQYHRKAGEHTQMVWGEKARHGASHLMIETHLEEADVLALADANGCHAHRARHASFEVIEFWIDDCQLLDVMTPDMARVYREFNGMLTRSVFPPGKAA